MHILKNLLQLLVALLIFTVLGSGLVFLIMRSSIPTKGEQGVEADTFASLIQESVQRKAWARTGAIQWSMLSRDYLWDLRRGLVKVKFDEYIVMFDVNRKRTFVKRKNKQVLNKQAEKIVNDAYGTWIRDVFILEPTQTLFDKGVKRFIIDKGLENESLFIYYEQGGLFPGDSYQWFLDKNGFPNRIKVWSKEYPTQGIPIRLEKWKILKTGLKISTYRSIGILTMDIKVKADLSLTHLIGRNDPFEDIQADPFEATPSSQPNYFKGSDEIDMF